MAMAIGIIGGVLSLAGSMMAASAQQQMVEEQTAASKKAENARQQQMQLDAQHRRRGAIREAIMARSMSLTVGTAQGVGMGSGVAGAMGAATGMGAENQQMTTASETLGGRVFSANREFHDATLRGSRGMAFGQGLSAIGGALVSNAGTIGRLGTYFGGQQPMAANRIGQGLY